MGADRHGDQLGDAADGGVVIGIARPVALSLGGGLDSWVMLLEAVRRGERVDVVVFVDVGYNSEDSENEGDPGEWPGTYRHIREVVIPFCELHGIRFVWITGDMYPVRDARSLFAWMHARHQIPVAGYDRICTRIAKVERFEAWMDANYPGQEVEVWIGFEAGEESRVAKDPNAGEDRSPTWMRLRGGRKPKPADILHNSFRWARGMAFAMSTARRVNRFPLLEWGLCRCRAEVIARASGHPVPRKSACVKCPYASRGDVQYALVQLPRTSAKIADLEDRKPLTVKNGRKLTIWGYDSRTQTGTPMRAFAAKPYRAKIVPCKVCGAAQRATKSTQCGYLAEAA